MKFANGKQVNLSDIKEFCHKNAEYSSMEVSINGKRRFLVNVPADGWCLLYSFIASYNSTAGPKASISDLCVAIMRQFQLKSETKSLPYEFLTIDQESQSLIASKNDSVEQVFKFLLIRYFKDKYFDTFVLDYIPQLIADYFECTITIFTFVSGSLNLFNQFNADKENERCVELLFCPDLSHFMALSTTDKVDQKYQSDNFEILKINNQFYQSIFKYYDKSI